MNDQNHIEQLQNFLDSIPEKLVAGKLGVPVSAEEQKAYIDYHDQIDFEEHHLEDLLGKIKDPSTGQLNIEEKKELLFLLGHEGSVEAFRLLEEHLDQVGEDLKGWTALCLEECRNLLESDLLEEDWAIVMTQMGGEGHRLRYAIILSPKKGLSLGEKEKKILEKVVDEVTKEKDSTLEKIEFKKDHALLTLLISMDVPVDDVIMPCIYRSNEESDFLRVHYFCTNTDYPTQEEIEQYLSELE